MQRARTIRILLIAALIGALALSVLALPKTAHAQSMLTYDFSVSDQGFTAQYTTEPYPMGDYISPAWHTKCWDHGPGFFTQHYFKISRSISSMSVHTVTLTYLGTDPSSPIANLIVNLNNGAYAQDLGSSTITDNTAHTMEFVFDQDSITEIEVQMNTGNTAVADCPSGDYGQLLSIAIDGNPTPETPPSISLLPDCPLLTNTNALFASGSAWQYSGETIEAAGLVGNPEGEDKSLYLPPGSLATLQLILSKYKQYQVLIKAKLTDLVSGDTDSLQFSLGDSSPITFPLQENEELQTFQVPSGTYQPTESQGATDFYTLTLSNTESDPEGSKLVVDYVCIIDPSVTAGSGLGDASSTTCKACLFDGSGNIIDDIINLFKWIWCAIGQLWDCVIKPIFYGIWKSGLKVLEAFAFARLWLSLVFSGGFDWLGLAGAVLSAFIGGLANNILTSIANAVISTLQSLGLTHIANDMLKFLSGTAGQGNIFVDLFSLVGTIFNLIGALITFVATTLYTSVVTALTSLYSLFASILGIFNVAAAVPPGIPACDTSAAMIPESCVGLFIIDNTVLADGGLLWTVLPLIEAAAGLGVIWWGVNDIKKGLEGNESDE